MKIKANSLKFKKTFKETIDQLIREEQELKVKNQQRPERESKVRDLKKVIELKSRLI